MWLGDVPAAAAAVVVVLTVSTVAVAALEFWLFPWPPWVRPFLALIKCVIIVVGLSVGAWSWTFVWSHTCSWRAAVLRVYCF